MNFFKKLAQTLSYESGKTSTSNSLNNYNSKGTSSNITQNRPTQNSSDNTISKAEQNSDNQKINKNWTTMKPTYQYRSSSVKSNNLSNLVDRRFQQFKRKGGSRGLAMI